MIDFTKPHEIVDQITCSDSYNSGLDYIWNLMKDGLEERGYMMGYEPAFMTLKETPKDEMVKQPFGGEEKQSKVYKFLVFGKTLHTDEMVPMWYREANILLQATVDYEISKSNDVSWMESYRELSEKLFNLGLQGSRNVNESLKKLAEHLKNADQTERGFLAAFVHVHDIFRSMRRFEGIEPES